MEGYEAKRLQRGGETPSEHLLADAVLDNVR
jgi:hypothetical protein